MTANPRKDRVLIPSIPDISTRTYSFDHFDGDGCSHMSFMGTR